VSEDEEESEKREEVLMPKKCLWCKWIYVSNKEEDDDHDCSLQDPAWLQVDEVIW
jgi:hypothetical protein